jgi:hypothetical protein
MQPQSTEQIVSVTPLGSGWAVTWPFSELSLMFRSASRAEAEGRSLANRMAQLGYHSRLIVHDRRGGLAGAVTFSADRPGNH